MKRLALVLGDQLFPNHHEIPLDTPIFMREDWGLCTRTRHHKHKIVLFLAAMRHHAAYLRESGRTVFYQSLTNGDTSYANSLSKFCNQNNVKELLIYEPADPFFLPQIKEQVTNCEIKILPNQSFITPRDEWEDYRRSHKRLLMADFYREQRKRLNLLNDSKGEPLGGRWSFDDQNRKPIPANKIPPATPRPTNDEITNEVIELVNRLFPDHPGNATTFSWPVTRSQALAELDHFIEFRLYEFGPFEDAISQNHPHLFHSLLSPLINVGLLTPKEIIEKIINSDAPLASREGFVRQVIGWREFIYHVAQDYRNEDKQFKPFNGQRKMKSSWYEGTTGLPPLDHCINKAINSAYCHHIERLMVLGSPMLMVGIDPDEVYEWFMCHFIDSADWVMAPNVYGMSQFADDGLFATKPYVSGSAYILKMSDFPKGEWCDVWDGLYWRFIDTHQESLAKNHRMGMMVNQLNKIDSMRKAQIFAAAEAFIERTTE